MADALCGPSNPLQSLQKQALGDRSLQQDRLRSTRTADAGQGFRSNAGQIGALDHEAEAFLNGQPFIHQSGPAAFNSPFSHVEPFNAPIQAPTPQIPAPLPASNWAADFQRLSIAKPQPRYQSIAQNRSSTLSSPLQAGPSLGARQTSPLSNAGIQPFGYSFPDQSAVQQNLQSMGQVQLASVQSQQEDQAFQRMFEELDSSFEKATAKTQQRETVPVDIRVSSNGRINQPGAVADKIDKQTQPAADPQKDADALSRAAGELLDNVREDQSEKFRNSTFLDLMRRLRDKEVTVEGDKMVEVDTRITPTQVSSLPPNSAIPDFNVEVVHP